MIESSSPSWEDLGEVMARSSPAGVKQLISRAEAAWERDEFSAALVGFREVLKVHPDFPDIRNRAGFCRAMLGDREGALDDFDHAIRIHPDYAEAHLNRALVLNDLGRFAEAREAFARARELDDRPGEGFPADLGNRIAEEHAKLGDLYLQADRPRSALEEYRKALDLRPEFVDIRSRLARVHAVLGELDEAVAELNRALEERPSFVAARIRLGAVLRRMGRTDEAVAEWRRCLEVNPRDRRARAYLISAGVKIEEVQVEGVDDVQ